MNQQHSKPLKPLSKRQTPKSTRQPLKSRPSQRRNQPKRLTFGRQRRASRKSGRRTTLLLQWNWRHSKMRIRLSCNASEKRARPLRRKPRTCVLTVKSTSGRRRSRRRAAVLRGTTLEEIEDHAAELKALLPEPRKAGQVPAEGRTVTTGTGDPAQQFAELIRNARK